MIMDSNAESQQFLPVFFERLWGWCYSYQDRYWDVRRFGPQPKASWLEGVKHRLKIWGGRRGWAGRHFSIPAASAELTSILMRQQKYAHGYTLMSDAYSKQVYLDLLAFRVLGPRHVCLPANTPAYWREYSRDDEHVVQRNTGRVDFGPIHWTLNRYDIPGKTGILRLHMVPGSYQYYFVLRGYDYEQGGVSIGVEPGDVVINGGGCWGDTDVIFADRCAPDGRVYTFEFNPENLEIMRRNLAANPELAPRIVPVEKALSDISGQTLAFSPFGPGTQVNSAIPGGGGQSVATLAIDDLTEQHDLRRVDFIKMDIEGSELQALRGAERTLRRFRPKLAISAYHKPEDLFTLVDYIDRLNVGYRFYLDHFTVHMEETVLFASCGKQGQEVPRSAQ